MKQRTHSTSNARAGWSRWLPLGAGVLVVSLAACNPERIVNLDNPDLITGPVARDPANLPTVRAGTLFEFGRAYAGAASNASDVGQIQLSGLLADEIWFSSTYPTHREVDRRAITLTNTSALTSYRFLHRARNLAEQASALFVDAGQANTADRALVASLAGYSYVLFGENYCSGVPFSSATLTGAVEFGPPRTTDEILNLAVARFDEAIAAAQAANSGTMLNLARVGKARALLDLGRFNDAAQVAAQVTTGFEYFIEYNSPSPENGVWFWMNSSRRLSPASLEGVNGLRYFNRGAGVNTIDPRVPTDSIGFGLSSSPPIPQYFVGVYPNRDSNIPLATWIEARLIQAEAALNKGASNTYLPVLNSLRATIGLGALADPGPGNPRVLQLYQERAFWLWMTSHRLGDVRRLTWYYGFNANQVFPIGTTIFGEPYGNDVALPVPFEEENNPQFPGGCLPEKGS